MNNFKLILNGSEIKGVVFPFRYAELLDERLDEAYVDFYNRVEFYEPLTEAKIEIYQDEKLADTLYFVVGNDNSAEYPAGSGVYKHSVYLIERTKLLDGIVCSSLTFTNTLVTRRVSATIQNDLHSADECAEEIDFPVTFTEIPSKVSINEPYTFPSAKTLAETIAAAFQKTYPQYETVTAKEECYIQTSRYGGSNRSSSVTVINDGQTSISASWDKTIKVTEPKHPLSLTYRLCIECTTNLIAFGRYYIIGFDIFVEDNKISLKKWTITDCINRVLECAKPLFGDETPEYKLNDTEAAKYENILAPEFSMTQCTLREQLKVIGSFIHAEPWLDEDNIIHFKSLGTIDQCSLQNKHYVYSGAKTDINQYCTEVRSYAKNVVSALDDSSVMNESSCALRAENQYVRIEEGNGIVYTNLPIYSIKHVTCGIIDDSGDKYFVAPVDITPYVFEATEYNANLTSYAGTYPYAKEYALYYTLGEKHIKGLFFMATAAMNTATYSEYAICNILATCNANSKTKEEIYNNLLKTPGRLVFTVEYNPIYSSLVSHGKNYYENGKREYAQIYNQTENIVESKYYGENLKGVAARLGNPEEERTYILKDFSDIPEVGQMLDGYAISSVSAEIMPYHIKCTVGLSKDFNRISEYVGISSIKRMYEVSERQVYNRDILIKDTLVVGKCPENYTSPKTPFIQSIRAFKEIFTEGETTIANTDGTTKTSSVDRIIHAYATMKSKNKSIVETDVLLPVSTSVFGNVMTCTFSYKDNYSAGDKTAYMTGKNGVAGRWQTDIRYTDFYGRAYWLDFKLGRYIIRKEIDSFELFAPDFNFPFNNPEYTPKLGGTLISIDNYRIRKDSRERISVTYELEAQSNDPDIIIGSEFMRLCRLVNEDIPQVRLLIFNKEDIIDKFDLKYTYTGTNSPYYILDTYVKNETTVRFTLKTPHKNQGYGWAIVSASNNVGVICQDEDGNIDEYIEHKGDRFLILCTAKNQDFIELDFFLTRK